MGKNYDNWGRLVEAVVRREQLRSLGLADSRSPSIRSLDSDSDSDYTFTSTSSYQQNLSFRTTPSPLHTQLKQSGRIARTRNVVWKGLSIFRGFSSKKENEREEREVQWANQRTLHGIGIHQMENRAFSTKQNNGVDFYTKEVWERNAEITRFRESHTLKGHIEALAKAKGIDLDSIFHSYTV